MRKHFPLLLLAIVLGFGAPANTYGQTTADKAPAGAAAPDTKMLSGTAVGAGLSGIASPNLFSGSMNVSVPIYNYGNSAYGVSLNYNTQGVRVDEFAGPVGLHWNLTCGGAIVRVMRDLPDELSATTDSLLAANQLSQSPFDDYGPRIYVPNKEMHIYGKLFAYGESPAKLNAANAYADHECDEFDVSLPGMGFKFYIGKDLKVFTTSSQDIKVQLLADNSPITNISQLDPATQTLNFKVTDSRGNQFYFQSYASDEFTGTNKFWDWAHLYTDSDSFPPNLSFGYPTNWRLEKIILINGKTIHYQYSATGLTHSVPYSSDQSYLNYYVSETLGDDGISLYNYGGSGKDPDAEDHPISEIDYPGNVQVYFQYDTQHWNGKGNYFLDEIKISSEDNCQRFHFYENQDAVNKRYFLDSIVQVSCDGTVTEPYYSFTYNPVISSSPTVLATLPRRLNAAQDLYGFYNNDSVGVGASATHENIGNYVTIPRHHQDIGGDANYGNERDYDGKYAQAGLLTSVTNAYGGEEYFYYAPNIISANPLFDSVPSGYSYIGRTQVDGVCVDSIVRRDPSLPGKRQLTTFDYSSGQLFMPGGYFHYPNYIDSATGTWEEVIYQSMFLTAHQLVNGANHGYSTVDVKNYADGQLLSRRVTTYTNMQDASSGNKPRYYKVPGSKDFFDYPYTNKQYLKDWEIGLPLTITDYDQDNHIIKKTINQYDFSQPDLSAASIIANANTIKVNSGTSDDVGNQGFDEITYPYKKIFIDNYYPFKGIATLNSTVTQKYITDTRLVTDTVWYYYDDHHNLSETVTQDSKGEKTATHLVYNYNVDGPTAITGLTTSHPGTTLYNMTDSGLELAISNERWLADPSGNLSPFGQKLPSAFITQYQYQNGRLWTKGLLNTDNGQPLTYTEYTGLSQGGPSGTPYNLALAAYNTTSAVDHYRRTSQVSLFDAKGNPLETQLQGQDQYKAMIWDTASGQKLAEAANCRYSDIVYTSFENSLPEGNLTGNKSYAIASSGAITGSHVGLLWTQTTPGTAISFTGAQNLKAGKAYILSFWVYGAIPAIYAGSQVIPISSANLTYTKGSWHNYQVQFTPSAAGKLKITGTAAFSQIDEIRLFPVGAQMQSATYEPLFGKSSETDPSGKIIYYRYDPMGRQDLVLDMDGNVLSKTDYHVAH